MPLIIDCYNLLHQPMPPSLAGLDEGGLCRAISSSLWGQEETTVVCDGVAKRGVSAGSPAPHVRVIYSGGRRTADDVIRSMVRKSSAPRRLTVVSNDREIQQGARQRRARVLTCAAFIHTLVARATAQGGERDTKAGLDLSKLPNAEQWAAQFGVDPQQSLDELER